MPGEDLSRFLLTEEKEKLDQGRCPCCGHFGSAEPRAEDGMVVCGRCAAWAYRDLATGRLAC